MNKYIAFFDFETAGLPPNDQPIELGLIIRAINDVNSVRCFRFAIPIVLDDNQCMDPNSSLINGVDNISAHAGFAKAEVLSWLQYIMNSYGNDILWVHWNRDFDPQVMHKYFGLGCNMTFIDLKPFALYCLPDCEKYRSLTDIASLLHVEIGQIHTALGDSQTLANIFAHFQLYNCSDLLQYIMTHSMTFQCTLKS